MVVFSNHRLGPSAELLVSDDVAMAVLTATATAARPFAEARWELELVLWLDRRSDQIGDVAASRSDSATRTSSRGGQVLDVADIAWTPEHFEPQRRFLIDAILRAAATAEHALAFDRWRRMIEAHPADSVQVGRRWQWQPTA
jgi:hypothetical protein